MSKVLDEDRKTVTLKWKTISTALRSTRGLGLHRWREHMQSHLNVILFLMQCCFAQEGGPGGDGARVAAVLERCNVLAVQRERAAFSGRSVEQDLGRLLRGSSTEQHRDVLERALAPPAIAAVLSFSEVMADRAVHGRYSLSLYDPGRYLRLDAAAQRALNVLKGKGDANDRFSLLGLLSKGRTQMGRRLCKVLPCCSVRVLCYVAMR